MTIYLLCVQKKSPIKQTSVKFNALDLIFQWTRIASLWEWPPPSPLLSLSLPLLFLPPLPLLPPIPLSLPLPLLSSFFSPLPPPFLPSPPPSLHPLPPLLFLPLPLLPPVPLSLPLVPFPRSPLLLLFSPPSPSLSLPSPSLSYLTLLALSRELERERGKLERQEKKIITDIKKMAKTGQMVWGDGECSTDTWLQYGNM